ncbi:ATPase [Rhodococcus sp. 15-649-1-2]|nr:ATPase [Rhodococcus sp. 15-649-1-2]
MGAMNPTPTGLLRATASGVDVEIIREITSSRDDVWSSATVSDRTALWFRPWERLADNRIRVQMVFEDGEPWMEMNIDACEPPRRLAVSTTDGWALELVLTGDGPITTVTLIHHRESTDGVGEIGPGWEYYLDLLIASRTGAELPTFEEYYPAQKGYYESLTPR